LGVTHASYLSQIALEPTTTLLDTSTQGSEEPVLGLSDLIRERVDGTYTLHPRVQQTVHVGTLDVLLEALADRLDRRPYYIAYPYPQFLLECRGAAPDQTSLNPPEFHIRTLDVLRDLRANDILTTVCRPGDSVPPKETLRGALDSMEQHGTNVNGIVTLVMDESSVPETPRFILDDQNMPTGKPSQEDISYLLEHLSTTFGVIMETDVYSSYRGGTVDE
jgi:hypothetical protein